MRILGDKPNMELFLGLCIGIVVLILAVPTLEKLTSTEVAPEEGAEVATDSHASPKLKKVSWAFDGITGKFDIASVQRGYQVYREVCSTCHSMNRIAFRNLQQIGFSEEQVKQLASESAVTDGPDNEGKMFIRPGLPSDRFQAPFANEKAARAANGGAFPPDLSLMSKARTHGPDYMFSLLTGYKTAPHDVNMNAGKYYNAYFPGNQISMPPPIDDDSVEYADGTPATKEQISKDIVNFLQWSAEPEMEQRKSLGVKVLVYMFILTIMFYFAKKRIWSRIK